MSEALTLEQWIEADVSPAFAWRYRTDIGTWDDPPATFRLDGPFVEGVRGTTLMPGQDPIVWWVRDVRPERSFAIEMPLDGAALRFDWYFAPIGDRRTRLTQRITLTGTNAAAYRDPVAAGFGATLQPGMKRLAAAMVAAANGE